MKCSYPVYIVWCKIDFGIINWSRALHTIEKWIEIVIGFKFFWLDNVLCLSHLNISGFLYLISYMDQPLLHLLRSLVGKRHSKNSIDIYVITKNKVGNLVYKCPGFSTSCSCKDKTWSIDVQRCRQLFFVQLFTKVFFEWLHTSIEKNVIKNLFPYFYRNNIFFQMKCERPEWKSLKFCISPGEI